jgi:hypothetical protein
MDPAFLKHVKENQLPVETVSSNAIIYSWGLHLIFLLYPEHNKILYSSTLEIQAQFDSLPFELWKVFRGTPA